MRILDAGGTQDDGAVGGKVSTLLRLSKHFPVPEIIGLIQDTAADEMVPDDLDARLLHHADSTLFAIRSSANVEDSLHSSFAGVFESVLGVPKDRIREAIHTVLESARSERALAYMFDRGVQPSAVRMGVGIQRMISCRMSGVAFTHLPADADGDGILVEAILGLGEVLVQGQVTPEQWEIARRDLTVTRRTRSVQTKQLLVSDAGGTAMVDVASTERRADKLSGPQAVQVAKLALDVESELGLVGLDIEWGIDDNQLWLLQARPLTTSTSKGPG